MADTLIVFCANEQADTEHTLDIDQNNEIVLTCACGRFLKFPAGTSADVMSGLLEKHKEANEGQVSVASIDEQKAELVNGLKDEQASVAEADVKE